MLAGCSHKLQFKTSLPSSDQRVGNIKRLVIGDVVNVVNQQNQLAGTVPQAYFSPHSKLPNIDTNRVLVNA